MQDSDPQDAKLLRRQEIIDELWAVIQEEEHGGAVHVAALDKLAKIEGAYTPIRIETKKKFVDLAAFYAGVALPEKDITADVKSEAAASTIPTGGNPAPTAEVENDDPDVEDDFFS